MTYPGLSCGEMRFLYQQTRQVHVGHIKTTLRKLDMPVPRWLQHVDQAPTREGLRREKDKYARELLKEKENVSSLFGDSEKAALSKASRQGPFISNEVADSKRERIAEALKMYRILQPEALPFYKEDALLAMKAKLGEVTSRRSGVSRDNLPATSLGDPFQLHLPVVNPTSFMLALEAATQSLSDDLEYMCVDLFGVDESALPEKNHPERFLQLVQLAFNAFPLRKDPSHVDQFMLDSWPRLKALIGSGASGLSDQEVAEWLRGHLERVIANQRGSVLSRSEWYSFSQDFKFDHFANPRAVGGVEEFDFTKTAAICEELLVRFGMSPSDASAASQQLQQLVYACEKIGLKTWLNTKNIDAVFDKHLPRGPVPQIDQSKISPTDIDTAKLMLKCAARGKPNLLDFDALSPSKLLHSFPTTSVQSELDAFCENPFLADSDIDHLIDIASAAKTLSGRPAAPPDTSSSPSSPLEELVQSESEFARSAGPADWDKKGDWKWKRPSGALFDERVGKYVRNQSLVDPNLNMASFRQYTCDVRRMCSMSSAGRVYYARSIVVVGNGQGIYGFGVGFGNTPRESNADAAVKALRNLKFVDYDPTRTLTTPVRGSEYKARLFLRPLRQGKKLRAGRRFLPLFYILGLHNVRARFNHTGWFPRIKAVERTLDQIQSRRTLANATGKKYADITAPGDHWVHWPDRWFDVIRRSYQSKEQRVKTERKRLLHNKTRGHIVASPMELKPGWTKYAWMNPLAKWNKEVGRSRVTARTVRQIPVSEHFPPSIEAPADVVVDKLE